MDTIKYLVIGILYLCTPGVNAQFRVGGVVRHQVFPQKPLKSHGHQIQKQGARLQPVVKTNAALRQEKLFGLKAERGCPEGFVRYRERCFSHSLIPKTWRSARLACRRAAPGGDLASINSREEFEFIQNEFSGGENDQAWIGLSKQRPGTPYKWSNGDPVRYLPWDTSYTGQEPTGYVALSLINLHFLSKTSRKELLQFFCGSRTDSSPSKASAAAVDGVYPVKRDPTRGSVATGGDVAGMQLSCRDGWESFQGKCYKAFYEKKNFDDASAKCRQEGAHLLSLHSPKESQFVRRKVLKNRRPGDRFWLGLTNSANGLQWSDGSPVDYTNFRPGMTIVVPKREVAPVEAPEKEFSRKYLERCFQINSDETEWASQERDQILCIACVDDGEYIPPTTRGVETTLPDTTTDPNLYAWNMMRPHFLGAAAAIPMINVSGLNITLNDDFINGKQKSASGDSVSENDSNPNTVTLLVVLVGSVVLMVAVLGAVSYRRQHGNFRFPWTSLKDESHNLQKVRQSLRGVETGCVNQQGVYGAVE
ncbi:hypothetical protein RRG08_058164 [Elysia crispata]|uniref:C-type lectin domain-containing protein n=1 Tax=Elysia crispata TaxID=231223 RepID=A0AAE0Y2R8_9GAST|nr:hypothetical protein RRG08_058164 [Elysia crispata]